MLDVEVNQEWLQCLRESVCDGNNSKNPPETDGKFYKYIKYFVMMFVLCSPGGHIFNFVCVFLLTLKKKNKKMYCYKGFMTFDLINCIPFCFKLVYELLGTLTKLTFDTLNSCLHTLRLKEFKCN